MSSLLHLLQKREIKNPKPNEQASRCEGLTVPGKLDCIPSSLPNSAEEQRGGFPKSGVLPYCMLAAAKTWTEPKITPARLCPQACYGNSGSPGSYIGNIYEDLSYLEVPIEGVFLLDWCLQPMLIQPWNSLYSPSEWVFAYQGVLALGLPTPTQICIRAAPSGSQEADGSQRARCVTPPSAWFGNEFARECVSPG